MEILLVNTADFGGGAETSARNVFEALRQQGHHSRLLVGNKRTNSPDISAIVNDSYRNLWARSWIYASYLLERLPVTASRTAPLRELFEWIGEPQRKLEVFRGHEDFDFPGVKSALELGGDPDVVHCFNLHGRYFDLELLPWLSNWRPLILDLRDAWLLSGHCAHSFDCERWRTGCGECPDLQIYPPIRRDGTAFNWRRKRAIYARSRLYVSTPCRWLMQKVEESMLAPAVVESRVIPTGVDLTVFRSGNKIASRRSLNLPEDARILIFAAHGIRRNIWRDYNMLQQAVSSIAHGPFGAKVLVVALGEVGLGENSRSERIGEAEIRFIPRQDPETLARYYQASDIYIHAAKADTFPRAVLEALACGAPVVATAVGGIPEQVNTLTMTGSEQRPSAGEPTGILVNPRDPEALASALRQLLNDEPLRRRLSQNAARDAQTRFDLQTQVRRYVGWYKELASERALASGYR
jgi:glycosyltransferase involved in cell wall biosynthesis